MKLGQPPAGNATVEARGLDISRLALSSRIKQGATLKSLHARFVELLELEEELIEQANRG